MNELHIVTVGISLLTKFAAAENKDIADVYRYSQQVNEFLHKDPCAHCAEINALQNRCAILDTHKPPIITLVVNGNKNGELAGKLIGKCLVEKGAEVRMIRLSPIDVAALEHAEADEVQRVTQASLLEMREKIESHVKKARKQDPDLNIAFNMTGGYKAEVAVLYELGKSLHIPVYYMHESYRICIDLP